VLWSIGTVILSPELLHRQMSTIPNSTNQLLKRLRFPRCRFIPRSSQQMQPTMPRRFVSTTGNEGSRAISRPTRDPGYTRSGEGHAGSIRYCIKNEELLNGSSAGSRRSRRLFLDMNAMSTHSSG